MAPRAPESKDVFVKRLRSSVFEGGRLRVRRLELPKARVDAYVETHRTFMPEHAEMSSEPTGVMVYGRCGDAHRCRPLAAVAAFSMGRSVDSNTRGLPRARRRSRDRGPRQRWPTQRPLHLEVAGLPPRAIANCASPTPTAGLDSCERFLAARAHGRPAHSCAIAAPAQSPVCAAKPRLAPSSSQSSRPPSRAISATPLHRSDSPPIAFENPRPTNARCPARPESVMLLCPAWAREFSRPA